MKTTTALTSLLLGLALLSGCQSVYVTAEAKDPLKNGFEQLLPLDLGDGGAVFFSQTSADGHSKLYLQELETRDVWMLVADPGSKTGLDGSGPLGEVKYIDLEPGEYQFVGYRLGENKPQAWGARFQVDSQELVYLGRIYLKRSGPQVSNALAEDRAIFFKAKKKLEDYPVKLRLVAAEAKEP